MNCEEAKILLAPLILGDLDGEPSRSEELRAHLLCCPSCAATYEGFEESIGFVLSHQSEFAQAFEHARTRDKGIDVSIPSPPSRLKMRRIVTRASAVAAGLVIGSSAWMVFSDHFKPHIHPQNVKSDAVVSISGPSVKVELITPSGNMVIAASEPITTDSQIRELLINDRHRLVLGHNTTLSVNPLLRNRTLGCMIRVYSGQILALVDHAGKPFEVHTFNSRSTITGTTLDIQVQDQTTTLIVSEGSVRFESRQGSQLVGAGKRSAIVADGIPTVPESCQAEQLMAWAAGMDESPQLAGTVAGQELDEFVQEPPLPLTYPGHPIDLESLEYGRWIAEKRDWFKGQFPWIFEFRDALAREGVQVDYPDLMIRTGDIWQIVYPERFYRIIPAADSQSLSAVAHGYGLDETWLSQAVASAGDDHSQQHEMAFGLAALERWQAECSVLRQMCDDREDADAVYEYSYAIGAYLEHTRALLWLCVKNREFKVAQEHEMEILDLLRQQVSAAHICTESARRLSLSGTRDCPDRNERLEMLVDGIETIIELETRIVELGVPRDSSPKAARDCTRP